MLSKHILQQLQEENARLANIISEANRALQKCPEGSVRISKHKGGVQFYYRKEKQEKNGLYIPTKERATALRLIQKRYLERVASAAEKQKRAIESFLRKYDPGALADVFKKEGELRRGLLHAVELPDEEYAKRWQGETYTAKGFGEQAPEQYTEKGERVRSKSEVIIANGLNRFGIPYRYECPLQLSSGRIHPDFTILRMSDRKELFWEHLGMMDDMEYRNHAFRRIRDYEKNGIFPGDRLIITIETGKLPLNSVTVEQTILHYLSC